VWFYVRKVVKNVTLEKHGNGETAKVAVWLGRGNTCPRAPDKDKGQRTKDNEAKVERSGVVMKVDKKITMNVTLEILGIKR
jgi:hypothetical protein